jgi:hypothetical protein
MITTRLPWRLFLFVPLIRMTRGLIDCRRNCAKSDVLILRKLFSDCIASANPFRVIVSRLISALVWLTVVCAKCFPNAPFLGITTKLLVVRMNEVMNNAGRFRLVGPATLSVTPSFGRSNGNAFRLFPHDAGIPGLQALACRLRRGLCSRHRRFVYCLFLSPFSAFAQGISKYITWAKRNHVAVLFDLIAHRRVTFFSLTFS